MRETSKEIEAWRKKNVVATRRKTKYQGLTVCLRMLYSVLNIFKEDSLLIVKSILLNKLDSQLVDKELVSTGWGA
jgi:hypothetical protein